MAGSTLTRFTWTNDTGTPTTPVGDGTLINNAQLQAIFDAVDAVFSGGGAYATLTLGGLLKVEGFGTHAVDATGATGQVFRVRNSSSAAGAYAAVHVGNDTSASRGEVLITSSTYTGGPDAMVVRGNGSGGVSVVAQHASGVFQAFAGGAASPQLQVAASTAEGAVYVLSPGGVSNYAGGALLIGAGDVNPGALFIADKAAAYWKIWPDSTGVLRIGATRPTTASGDLIGTVVGTQTSTRASKIKIRRVRRAADSLALLEATPVFTFHYKSGAYRGEKFYGIMADDSPAFAMDGGQSFNPVSAFGHTVLAIQALAARVRAVEQRGARHGR